MRRNWRVRAALRVLRWLDVTLCVEYSRSRRGDVTGEWLDGRTGVTLFARAVDERVSARPRLHATTRSEREDRREVRRVLGTLHRSVLSDP